MQTPTGPLHCPIRSEQYQLLLQREYYLKYGRPVGGQGLADAMNVLEAKARFEGEMREVFVRVGHRGDNLYLDLCDGTGRAVEITADGWSTVASPVPFLRTDEAQPLPEPVRGDGYERLRRNFNLNDDQLVLIVSWLLAALRSTGPYPILVIEGDQGSGKSTLTKMLQALIDPRLGGIRPAPGEERDLMIGARRLWIYALDNTSGIADRISDALCRLSTHGSWAKRRNGMDLDEVTFEVTRPIILNGIHMDGMRADLRDRSIVIHLPTITDEDRCDEATLWAEFEADRPRVLGKLLDAVSMAIRNFPDTRLDRMPRMADFARWVTAADEALGWGPLVALETYSRNRSEALEIAASLNPVVGAIRWLADRLEDGQASEHTASSLLDFLRTQGPREYIEDSGFPRSAKDISEAISRAEPLLHRLGVEIARKKTPDRARRKLISITRIREVDLDRAA